MTGLKKLDRAETNAKSATATVAPKGNDCGTNRHRLRAKYRIGHKTAAPSSSIEVVPSFPASNRPPSEAANTPLSQTPRTRPTCVFGLSATSHTSSDTVTLTSLSMQKEHSWSASSRPRPPPSPRPVLELHSGERASTPVRPAPPIERLIPPPESDSPPTSSRNFGGAGQGS